MSKPPHSAAVLTDLRDAWWSTDFLELIVSRLELEQYERVADLGCGHGHWGQRLLPLLAETATIAGVDPEAQWVDRATTRAAKLGLAERCHYQVGSVESLPFDDGAFDLVTCQTLLMHVEAVLPALEEMLRVLRPGGRVLFLEPDNVAQQFVVDSVNRTLTPQQLGELLTLFTACSRGRDALGRGDDCVGDRLPVLLTELKLEGLVVFQNERAGCIVPPYDDGDMAQLEQSIGHAAQGFWLWDEADARVLYQAGGGLLESFEAHYGVFIEHTRRFERQVRDGTYWCNNGSVSYIISATRPA